MPALSGMQLARKAKEINPSIKVVLMTSFKIKDINFLKYLFLRIDDLVQKPIRIGELTRYKGETKGG